MSNVDDVLDNWEEIDDARLNDQIHQIRRDIHITSEIPLQNGLPRIMIPSDDYYGNSYTQPSKPVVTILRRPAQQSNDVKFGEAKPKHPIKTLQQREQEYAIARLRILGSAKNPEDEIEGTKSQLMVNSIRIPNETDRSISDTDQCGTKINNQIRNNEGILRMPKGPDGTSGFTFRR